MFDKSNDSSSSSEDETTKNAIKEATDHQFLKDRFFANHTLENSEISKETKRKDAHDNTTNIVSLRRDLNHREQFSNNFVSQSFKDYVARKLDEIIEKSIRIKKKEKNIINEKEHKDDNYGIKLLNSSAEILTIEEENKEFLKFQNKRKIETIDEKAYLFKCKQVAVDPERILSKVDTKAWTNKRKGPEFNYKRLKNGILVEKPE